MSTLHALLMGILLAAPLLTTGILAASLPEVEVQLPQGRVRGTVETQGVHVFKGIPYAEAPVGDRRWRPPVGPKTWNDTRPALRFGPSCPQVVCEGQLDPGGLGLISCRREGWRG